MRYVTDMVGGRSQILDGGVGSLPYGFWMPKLRVVESRILDRIARFERGVERFCRVGSGGLGLESNGLCVWISASDEGFVPLGCGGFWVSI